MLSGQEIPGGCMNTGPQLSWIALEGPFYLEPEMERVAGFEPVSLRVGNAAFYQMNFTRK